MQFKLKFNNLNTLWHNLPLLKCLQRFIQTIMWKKIGAISPTFNDNYSVRSRDQNCNEKSYFQMANAKMSETQISFQRNESFFSKFLNKRKKSETSKLNLRQTTKSCQLQHVRSCKVISLTNMTNDQQKKTLNKAQIQQLNKKLSDCLVDQSSENISKNQSRNPAMSQQNRKQLDFKQNIASQTSLQIEVRKLKQCKSTPQFDMTTISVSKEQRTFIKKNDSRKDIDTLKKQNQLEKKTLLQSDVSQFSNDFKQNQNFTTIQQSRADQCKEKENNMIQLNEKKIDETIQKKSLDFQEITGQVKNFADKFKSINQKKAELTQKYMSLRVK